MHSAVAKHAVATDCCDEALSEQNSRVRFAVLHGMIGGPGCYRVSSESIMAAFEL